MSMEQEDPTCPDCGMPLRLGHSFDCPQHPETVKKEEKYAGRPEPKGAKRFELSEDPIIREKVTIYREGFRQLQATHPEVIGATLFGSSVKGRATRDSDVDSAIFINPKNALARTKGTMITPDIEYDVRGNGQVVTLFDPDTTGYYISQLGNYVHRASPDFGNTIVEHAFVLPLSQEIIDTQLDKILGSTQEYITAYFTFYNNTNHSQSSNSVDHIPSAQKMPNVIWPAANITALFHLQIDHFLDEYRKMIISRLEKEVYGEYVWRNIVRRVEMFEEWSQRSGKRFPMRLSQARKIYIHGESNIEDELDDEYETKAADELNRFLDTLINESTYNSNLFHDGSHSYQAMLRELGSIRGGDDYLVWMEYWSTKMFIDANSLYVGFDYIQGGIQPSIDDLNDAIEALPDGGLKMKWHEKADKLIATKKIA